MRGRWVAVMAVLTLAGAACGVQADQRTQDAQDAPGSAVGGEAVGEVSEDINLLKVIRCNPDEEGPQCERKCEAGGIWCPAHYDHPFKPRAGEGDLGECRDGLVYKTCRYSYDNGDHCWTRTAAGRRMDPVCEYSGGKP